MSNSETQRRLLDLLAGWANWCGTMSAPDHDLDAINEENEAISDLYQRVGAIENATVSDIDRALEDIRGILFTGGREPT